MAALAELGWVRVVRAAAYVGQVYIFTQIGPNLASKFEMEIATNCGV